MSYSTRTGTGGLGRTSVACSSESGAERTPVMAARNSRAADHDFWGIDSPSSLRLSLVQNSGAGQSLLHSSITPEILLAASIFRHDHRVCSDISCFILVDLLE
jgi:hypothetical protein